MNTEEDNINCEDLEADAATGVDLMGALAKLIKNSGTKPQDITCPNGHKVAEKKGDKICIKCKCRHVVEGA